MYIWSSTSNRSVINCFAGIWCRQSGRAPGVHCVVEEYAQITTRSAGVLTSSHAHRNGDNGILYQVCVNDCCLLLTILIVSFEVNRSQAFLPCPYVCKEEMQVLHQLKYCLGRPSVSTKGAERTKLLAVIGVGSVVILARRTKRVWGIVTTWQHTVGICRSHRSPLR